MQELLDFHSQQLFISDFHLSSGDSDSLLLRREAWTRRRLETNGVGKPNSAFGRFESDGGVSVFERRTESDFVWIEFADADCSFLAAHIALDQAARELAESLNRETRGEYAFQHFFDREVEADDEDTLCRVSDTGDAELNSLLDEVTEEALEIVEIMGQGGWVLDNNGNLVHNPQAAMYRV